jgi:tetratricopeptide (TPR) repeat protein
MSLKRSAAIASAAVLTLAAIAGASAAFAQAPPLTVPQPSQAATVSQTVGLTEITISYHRPRVQGREIWGKLVPYGEVWRAGANENTTIEFSTPVEIEGHPLAAGRYGFHTLPTAGAWQLIFSAVDSNWGSFAYDAKEDVLRVEVKPEPAPDEEALAYTFDDATARATTIALRWEKLRVPFKVTVDTPEIVYQSLKRELRGLGQFFWQPWNQAATTLLTSKVHLDDAMVWADKSIAIQKNFANSFTKSRLLTEKGDAASVAAAKKLMDEALPGANEAELNAYGYQLLGGANQADAVAIFRENVKRHPASWNAHDSLGEGLVAFGKKDEALAMYRKALTMAPEAQKARIQGIVDGLAKKP